MLIRSLARFCAYAKSGDGVGSPKNFVILIDDSVSETTVTL